MNEVDQDWQQKNLAMFRALVMTTVPDMEETIKWDVPVFLYNGKLVCAMSTFKEHTKFNFFKGAELDDSFGLFNDGLDSKSHRSINLAVNETVDQSALAQLILQAAELNK